MTHLLVGGAVGHLGSDHLDYKKLEPRAMPPTPSWLASHSSDRFDFKLTVLAFYPTQAANPLESVLSASRPCPGLGRE